jgi:hypothetical protein
MDVQKLSYPLTSQFAEAGVTIVGLVRDSDSGNYSKLVLLETNEDSLKFPGVRFDAPFGDENDIVSLAIKRFVEQTGFQDIDNYGLRAILPLKSRSGNEWMFRNVVFVGVNDLEARCATGRRVFLGNLDELGEGNYVNSLTEPENTRPIIWARDGNSILVEHIIQQALAFNNGTEYFEQIPVFGVPVTLGERQYKGTGLSVASAIVTHRPTTQDGLKAVSVKKKRKDGAPEGDDATGNPGGKVGTPLDEEPEDETKYSKIVIPKDGYSPLSACMMECRQELGFEVILTGLLGVSMTPLTMPDSTSWHNSIVNYIFTASPRNHRMVELCEQFPEEFLEEKMERLVQEDLNVYFARCAAGNVRTADMSLIAAHYQRFREKGTVKLWQFIETGVR